MRYYAVEISPAAYGMPEVVTNVYHFSSRTSRDFFVEHGDRYDCYMHPRPICRAITAREARALAHVDDYGDRYARPDPYGTDLNFYPWGSPHHDAMTR